MQKLLLIATIVLFLLFNLLESSSAFNVNNENFAVINNKKVFLEVADTFEKKMKGLMFVENMPENNGMVFLFRNSDYRSFWMKNVKIPLDIIFIDNGKIKKIYNALPICKSSICPTYGSVYKVDTVIELNGGFCEKFGIKEGDSVSLSPSINYNRAKLMENLK